MATSKSIILLGVAKSWFSNSVIPSAFMREHSHPDELDLLCSSMTLTYSLCRKGRICAYSSINFQRSWYPNNPLGSLYIIVNSLFSILTTFQYIAVIILFNAKNVPSLARGTLQPAPGPVLRASLLSGTIARRPALAVFGPIGNPLLLQGALVPLRVPGIFKGFSLGQ